jgi:hypothetical protein
MRQRSKSERGFALACGASSAFDISGLRLLRGGLFAPALGASLDPAAAVAHDMQQATQTIWRSMRCAQLAVRDGIAIETLQPGCTANGPRRDADQFEPAHLQGADHIAPRRRGVR